MTREKPAQTNISQPNLVQKINPCPCTLVNMLLSLKLEPKGTILWVLSLQVVALMSPWLFFQKCAQFNSLNKNEKACKWCIQVSSGPTFTREIIRCRRPSLNKGWICSSISDIRSASRPWSSATDYKRHEKNIKTSFKQSYSTNRMKMISILLAIECTERL